MKLSLAFLLFSLMTSGFAEDKVTLPLKAIPQNLNLDRMIQVDQFRAIALLSDSLFEMGENLQLNPKLAKSYRWTDQGRKLTVKIRKALFSDGSPVRIKDVKKSVLSCIKSGRKGGLSSFTALKGYDRFISGQEKILSGVKTLGSDTIEFILEERTPLLTEALSNAACSIVKKEGGRDYYSGAIGAGPYKLKRRSKDSITYEKNKLYYGTNTGPDVVLLKSTGHYGDFEKLKDNFSLVIAEETNFSDKSFNRFAYSRLGAWQLSFNNQKSPFNNPKVRKAVKLAINFNFIAKEMNYPPDRVQEGLFPFGMKGFQRRSSLKSHTDEANKLLIVLGYSRKKPLKIDFYLSKRKGSKKEAKIWRKAFDSDLIEINVRLVSHKELVKIRNEGKFDILKHGKSPGSIDAHILVSSYHSKSRFNTPKAQIPECDKKIVSALKVFDSEERFEKYQEIEKCLLDKDVIIPLVSLSSGSALVRLPWKITRTNQYLLYPYKVNEWEKIK